MATGSWPPLNRRYAFTEDGMTQKQQILKHMRTIGSINPMIAQKRYGIMRLAARIDELNAEHVISSVMVYRNCKRYAAYSLVSK